MADQKISQLSDGGASQATDEYVIARSGSNFRIDGASVAAAATSVGTLTSLTVSGNTIVGAEVFRGSDTSYMRLAGGNPASTGANLLLFGSTHASAPGRVSINASGAGNIELQANTTGVILFRTAGANERMRLDASGNLAVDTNTLYVDAANNRVGVGTTSPVGNINASSRVIAISGSNSIPPEFKAGGSTCEISMGAGSAASYLWSTGAFPMVFATNATERMRLNSAGNLGLGVTPSAWAGFSAFQANVGSVAGSSSELDISHNAFFDGAWKYIANGFATNHYQTNGAYIWRTAPSGTAGNTISFTQAMTLDASGNLGVGTATFGTSAAKVLGLANATEPSTAVANTIQFYSVDRSAGNTIPALRCEGTGVTDAAITDVTVTNKIAIKVNGTVYYLLATTSAS